ncbi:MAG: hypothetical protein IKO32_03495 [Lachnospiraceae bacterium]|nr:hypothetical protein [Lachnospiraceae bacterium]
MSEFFEKRKNRENTLEFMRQVERLHHEMELEKNKWTDISNSVNQDMHSHKYFEELKTAGEELLQMSDINNAGAIYKKLKQAYENYISLLLGFYSVHTSFLRFHNQASEETIKKMNEDAEKRAKHLASRFNFVTVSAKNLDEVLIQKEGEEEGKYTFPAITHEIQNTVQNLNLNPEEADLHAGVHLPADFNWITNTTFNSSIPAEEAEKFKKEAGINVEDTSPFLARNGRLFQQLPVDETVNETPASYVKTLGFKNRQDTVSALFAGWAVAQKGMSLDQAFDLYSADVEDTKKLLLEFYEYQKKHPFSRNNQSAEDVENNVTEWVKNFKKIQTAIEEYEMPDIDYSDPEQVAPYLKKFAFLQSLAVNCVQEFGSIMGDTRNAKIVSTSRIAAEVLGGEEEYYKMVRFLYQFQGMMALSYKFPYSLSKDFNGSNRMRGAYDYATGRYLASKMMPGAAGKTVKEFLDKNRNLFSILELQILMGQKDYFVANPEKIKPKTVCAYLMNHNKTEFEEQVEPVLQELEAGKTIFLSNIAFSNFMNYRRTPLKEEVRKKIAALPDDPVELKRTLYQNAEGNFKLIDLIDREFGRFFEKNFRAYVYDLGLKETDLFLIGGKSAKELWGDKYSDVTDPDEKETLYRLEILKVIARGNEKIAFRAFDLNQNNELQFTDTFTVFETRENTKKLVDAYKTFIGEQRDFLSELKEMKAVLLANQRNRQANFGGNEHEGGIAYQNLTLMLHDVIETLYNAEYAGDNPISLNTIRDKIRLLQEEAVRFYREKKGIIFGPSDARDKAGLKIAAKITNRNYLRIFDTRVSEFNSDSYIIGTPKITLANANYTKLFQGMASISHGFNNSNKEVTRDGLEDEYVRNKIKNRLDTIRAEAGYQAVKRGEKGEEKKLAQIYLDGYFTSKLGEKGPLKVDLLRDIEKFPETMEKLRKNPTFIKMMKEDPEGCIKNWEQSEQNAERWKAVYKTKSIEITRNNSYSRYVADLKPSVNPEGRQRTMAAEIGAVLASQNKTWEEKDLYMYGCYTRLSDVVLTQILSSPVSKSEALRERIVNDPDSISVMRDIIYNYFRNKNSLGQRNLTSTAEKIDNFSFRNTLRDKLTEEFARRDREKENQAKTTSRQVLERIDFIRNENIVLDEQMWNTCNAAADFTFANSVNQSIVSAGNRLLGVAGAFPYSDPNQPDAPLQNIRPSSEDYKGAGLNIADPGSLQNMFIIWLMAEKEFDFEAAVKAADVEAIYRQAGNVQEIENQNSLNRADQLRGEFYNFVRKNTISNNSTEQECENAHKNWADVYLKATNRMKNYQIPNVNYRDKEQLNKIQPVLFHLSSIGSTAVSEFGNLFRRRGPLSGIDVAREKMGEANFKKAQNFWRGLDAGFASYKEGFATYVNRIDFIGKNVSELNKLAGRVAVMRKLGVDELQNARNIKLGELTDKLIRTNHILYDKNLSEKINASAYEAILPGITPKNAYGYLQNSDTEKFEKTVDEIRLRYEKHETSRINARQFDEVMSFMNLLRTQPEHIKNAFSKIPDDDPDAMLQFMNEDAGEYGKMRDFAEIMFQHFEGGVLMYAHERNNQNIGDIFRLNGVNASDALINKYGALSDDKRETMYRMEILKAFLTGSAEVSVDMRPYNEGNFTEPREIKILPSKEEAVEISEGVRAYGEFLDEMITTMEGYKERLRLTQENRNANFAGNETEGSKSYRDLVRAVKDSIDVLKREKAGQTEPDEIAEALNSVVRATQQFDYNNRSFMGGIPTDPVGRNRFEISLELRAMAPLLMNRIHLMRQMYASDAVLSDGDTFSTGSYGSAKRQAEVLEGLCGIQVGEPEEYKNKFICREIPFFVDNLRELPLDNRAENAARTYLCEYYLNKVYQNRATIEDLRTLSKPLSRISELAANPVFVRWMSENSSRCILIWEGVENRERILRNSLRTQTENIRELYGSESAYLLGMPLSGNVGGKKYYENLSKEFNKLPPDEKELKYDTLSQIIYRQILSENYARVNRYNVAMDERIGYGIRDFITQKLKEYKLLENPAKMANVFKELDEGRYASSLNIDLVAEMTDILNKARTYILPQPKQAIPRSEVSKQPEAEFSKKASSLNVDSGTGSSPEFSKNTVPEQEKKIIEENKQFERRKAVGERKLYDLEESNKESGIKINMGEDKIESIGDINLDENLKLNDNPEQDENSGLDDKIESFDDFDNEKIAEEVLEDDLAKIEKDFNGPLPIISDRDFGDNDEMNKFLDINFINENENGELIKEFTKPWDTEFMENQEDDLKALKEEEEKRKAIKIQQRKEYELAKNKSEEEKRNRILKEELLRAEENVRLENHVNEAKRTLSLMGKADLKNDKFYAEQKMLYFVRYQSFNALKQKNGFVDAEDM